MGVYSYFFVSGGGGEEWGLEYNVLFYLKDRSFLIGFGEGSEVNFVLINFVVFCSFLMKVFWWCCLGKYGL